MSSSLTFSGLTWLWPVIAIAAAGLVALLWSYSSSAKSTISWLCFALKLLGITALVLCLLEPLWVRYRAKPGANLFAVLADNSQSLDMRDAAAGKTRADAVRALISGDQGNWQATLATTFDVRRYLFDTRLQSTSDFHELAFDGRSTALSSALRTLKERFANRPLAGVLLLSDGNATDVTNGTLGDLSGLPPIYPVVFGRNDLVHDIAVQRVQASESAFEDAPVTIQTDVTTSGFRGQPLVARLIDANGKVVQEETANARNDGQTVPFRFEPKPEKPGVSFYEVSVRKRDELKSVDSTNISSEATLANNRTTVVVDRGQGPFRVLYVGGRPNWEFKFFNRAVQADNQIELVSLIRVAKREPKFDFRGHAGESTNPLYRGFGNQAPEEAERYDQPVLVRLNTRDETELHSGFPRTPEELYRYDAIVLGDVEAEFFAPEQAALLQKFVSERGGGLLMLGGTESLANGNYGRTPIGEMLPVYLDGGDPGPEPLTGELHFQLSREGWLQPWARLRTTEAEERTRREQMTAFDVVNRVRGLKPGARLIASVSDTHGNEFPALAIQSFGRGRTATYTVGDVWRWGMRDPQSRVDMEKSWRQLVRWLVSDVPRRVQCSAEPVAGDASNAIRVQVRVRDEKFQPVDDASVNLEIAPVVFGGASAKPVKLEAEPSTAEAGLYETTYVPRLSGAYHATAVAKAGNGMELGRAEAGWSSDLAAEEFKSTKANVPLLEDLARRTGGRLVSIEELPAFARQLPNVAAPVMEAWTTPAWHTPALFAFALGCLVAEWGLRRWKGMP